MNENPEPIRIMAYLLDSGIDINRLQRVDEPDAATPLTGTALHHAVNRRDAERVRFLLQRGANRDVKGFRGFTALEAAEAMGLNEMAEVLRNE
jgi:ankyrin repeat protein